MRGTDCSLNHRVVVAAHDVAVRVDEAGQRRHALRIDRLARRRARRASRDRHDAAVPDDDRPASIVAPVPTMIRALVMTRSWAAAQSRLPSVQRTVGR